MPAVAKLMCMKGHVGKSPCRACKIIGVQSKDEKGHVTYYAPLSCPNGEERDGPRHYNPLELPRQTHKQFLREAVRVESSATIREENEQGRDLGITGLSTLSALSSLDFPNSFPHDLMHVIFENVLPMLINLWTRKGKWKDFGSGDEDYVFRPNVWEAIGEACAASGDTIPAAFGCRVPNLDKKRTEVTSEVMLLFATLLGPAVLRDRFIDVAYYRHFVQFVQLTKKCLAIRVSREDVDFIRQGFAKWVRQFEELYYRKDKDRIRVCTAPIHALLHLADDIEIMGPMWCYWAFPMERYCGALARANKSRRHPFLSLDRYVLHVAQLAQIKRTYGLVDELNLEDRQTNIVEGEAYPSHPGHIFTYPRREMPVIPDFERRVAEYISEVIGVEQRAVLDALRGRHFVHWGKMQQIDDGDYGGGDLVRAHRISPGEEHVSRDASYVKVFSDSAENIARLLDPLVIAVISPIPHYKRVKEGDLVEYTLTSGKLARPEIVDVRDIDCLVGRFTTGGTLQRRYVVDRTTVVGRLDMLDDTVDPE
ncbi:hypothetical protein FRC07_010018 [Ceratobasidium sp. 392]|nr:hypothetical protein FRC07_010018 [Ceratobasidium sp. 392]